MRLYLKFVDEQLCLLERNRNLNMENEHGHLRSRGRLVLLSHQSTAKKVRNAAGHLPSSGTISLEYRSVVAHFESLTGGQFGLLY